MAEINLTAQIPRTVRDFDARHAAQAQAREVAMKFDAEYFDGDRSFGYGGYRYDGRWLPVAETMRDHWGLKRGDRVLDIGAAKGFLLKDLMVVCPGLATVGVDISEYAVLNCDPDVKGRLVLGNAAWLPFRDASFTVAISINTLHNLERSLCVEAVKEIQRVSPGAAYIQVDAYRTPEERELFERWVLTAQTHDFPDGWRKLFAEAGYTGDYYWTVVE